MNKISQLFYLAGRLRRQCLPRQKTRVSWVCRGKWREVTFR